MGGADGGFEAQAVSRSDHHYEVDSRQRFLPAFSRLSKLPLTPKPPANSVEIGSPVVRVQLGH